jgi:polyphosphate kinase
MTKAKQHTSQINLNDPQYYFNRELSWVAFNRRVLHEALDSRTPLLERVKFVAIFSSNLDEFFMVRVAALKQQVEAEVSDLTPDGLSPQQQLDQVHQQLRPLVQQAVQVCERELLPQLTAVGVHLLKYPDLSADQRLYLQRYFESHVFPILTPLAVDPSHPFPILSNLSLNLAVLVKDPETGAENFARVKVPDSLPRFVSFPAELCQPSSVWTGVMLEEIVSHHLEALFAGMKIQECHLFRVTRDADLDLREDEADDLLVAIEQELRRRRFGGSVVRLQVQSSMSASVRKTLMQGMKVSDRDVQEIAGLMGLKDLMFFIGLPLPDLKDRPWTAVIPQRLRSVNLAAVNRSISDEAGEDIFSIIRQGDLLVHHPYESFTASVEHFITHAASDPAVQAIKMTLYRTSGDSPIAKALMTAAEQGKQVAVLVELKARFDEASNINWARELENAGVHVIYGLLGLKTHTKIALVVRQEAGELQRYVHIGTGNYNSKTAKLYTDLGLLSCRPELGADLTDLFNHLTGFSKQKSYRKLLVAPVTLRDRMVAMIDREIEHCQEGRSGRITAKMNALVDAKIIRKLYEASQAGVQIDLIVRGICCLRPGIPEVSDNIRVISIVGRYLEHSRIFCFQNNGQEEFWIGSADWMTRNLDERVEAVTPVEDQVSIKELRSILNLMMADNRQAWELQSDGSYIQRRPQDDEPEQSAQKILMEQAQQRAIGKR